MLKRKKKICVKCGHERWIYAKGLCQPCYQAAATLRSLERKRKKAAENGYKTEFQLFLKVWATRPKKSFLSGKPLNLQPEQPKFVNMFAHVLPKGLYPRLKYDPENIVLLTPEEHYAYDFYDMAKQKKLHPDCDWTKLYELRAKLMDKYNGQKKE